MRFGHNLHRHQVPEWADSYVPYSSLKALYKQAVREGNAGQPDFHELYIALEKSIDTVADFYKQRHAMLLVNEAELDRRARLPNVLNVNELGSLSQSLKDLLVDFNKLQWFYRVNKEALLRIYAKTERSLVADHQQDRNKKAKLAKVTEEIEKLVSLLTERVNSLAESVPQARHHAEASDATIRSCLRASVERFSQSPFLSEISDSLASCLLDDRVTDLSEILETVFNKNITPNELAIGKLLEHLAYLSITCNSKGCSDILLFEAMPKYGASPSSIHLNEMITTLGQRRHLADTRESSPRSRCECADQFDTSTSIQFDKLVQSLGDSKTRVLSTADKLHRTPLHYAALHDLPSICRLILSACPTSKNGDISSLALAKDFQQYTPLHYAVLHDHPLVVKTLLKSLCADGQANGTAAVQNLLFNLLSIAIRYEFDGIVELLAQHQIDPQLRSTQGETALYLATRTGHEGYVKLLLENGAQAELNTPEPVLGWTPILVACVYGHEAVVRTLLRAGAGQNLKDRNGWVPREHAALRGHLALAGILNSLDDWSSSDGPAAITVKPVPETVHNLDNEKSHVIVNLGVLQNGKSVNAVDLNDSSADVTSTKTGLSLNISVSEKGSETYVAELPLLADTVNEPFVFTLSRPNAASLSLKLSQQSSGYPASRTLIGSATALLHPPNDIFGENRESLVRERTIPIVSKETLDTIGTITFTFLIVRPMANPVSCSTARSLTKASGVQLVGHRGLGQNTASRNYLQLGENTVESFLTAARHGAKYVEFDAQLTRDLAAVIFHDFSLSESGTDIPVHDLTLDQFMHASNIQSPRGDPVSVLGRPKTRKSQTTRRSRSFSREHEVGIESIRDRMRYTVDFMNKGFKPNTRGDFIQDSFTTLDELLEKLPQSIGFNIEVKYPRLHEAAEAGVAPVAIEINTFVDKILERVFRSENNTNRDIILSSFTPEICILLALKQRKYPVMFITNAGKPPMTDMEMRASSLQAAVRFGRRWNLAGIVFACESLIMCPRLISYVKRSGLVCGSYGTLNNIPENAKIQASAGVDIIMADRIGLIAKALRDAN